jgi:GSH-dependent disulfide-bond oxidoreductase
MIDLYYYDTGNGQRPRLMLEEVGLPYRLHLVDLRGGAQRSPEFLAINPQGRIPALIDDDGPGGRRVIITQSLSMLVYLAEKTGQLLPADPVERAMVLDGMFIAATDIQPSLNAGGFLTIFGPVKHPEAGQVLLDRALASCQFIEDRLATMPFIGGDSYSIADIAAFTVVATVQRFGSRIDSFPRLQAWYSRLEARPAVQRALAPVAPDL